MGLEVGGKEKFPRRLVLEVSIQRMVLVVQSVQYRVPARGSRARVTTGVGHREV